MQSNGSQSISQNLWYMTHPDRPKGLLPDCRLPHVHTPAQTSGWYALLSLAARPQTNGCTALLTVTHRITTEDLLELRAVNVRAIRAARAPAVEQGLADNRGYDLIEVPEVRLAPSVLQGLQHSNSAGN